MEEELIKKIKQKKEFSMLPEKDVELVFEKINTPFRTDEEKIKMTRDLLRKIYTVFLSNKLLKIKRKNFDWFLKKHLSTRERFHYYSELYRKIIGNSGEKIKIYDLGCGINGFSFPFFKKEGFDVEYVGVEAVGQLVDLQKSFFKNSKKVSFFHESPFDINKISEIVKKGKGTKIVFLFKVIDSLEMLERNYSKKFLTHLTPLVDKVVLSFATRSIQSKKKFFANRKWIRDFISDNFNLVEEFDLGGENYIIFSEKDL